MNRRQRHKLGAGAGLVTMLLGALMVLAPGAGAVLPAGTVTVVGGGNVPICHATNAETNPYIKNSPSYRATGGFQGVNHDSHDGPVFKPGMKAQKIVWGDIIPPISVDGSTLSYPGKNWTDEARVLYADCIGQPDVQNATLVVEKDVAGRADSTKFSFTVGNATPQEIADGGSFEQTVGTGLISITEAGTTGYTLTNVSCTRDNGTGVVLIDDQDVPANLVGGTATITAVAGDVITCVFTNTLDTYGLTVAKKNDASGDGTFNTSEIIPTAGSPVTFQVELTNTGNKDLTVSSLEDTWSGLATPIDVLAAADLVCARPGGTVSLAAALPPGSRTTCTFTLPGYSPVAGTSRINEVTAKAGDTVGKAQSTVTTDPVIVPDPDPDPTPDPDPVVPTDRASLRIVKAVEAVDGGEVPTSWEVDIDVIGDGLDESRNLDEDVSSVRFGDIDAGQYTITETTPLGDTSTLTAVECVELGGGDVDVTEALSDKAATVVLDEGDEVECTFTNSYPSVLPDTEVPTEEPKPAAEPTEQVLGVQTTRTLPRTGDETRDMAAMGAFLVALGAALVLGSKRQLARR